MRKIPYRIANIAVVLISSAFAADLSVPYVKGATIFLDTNYNGQREINEPSAIAGLTGNYIDDFAGSDTRCIGFAPVVVEISKGSIDSNHNRIDTAKRITIPPVSQVKANKAGSAIDSLSHLIWQAMPAQQVALQQVENCEQAKEISKVSNAINSLIRDAIYDAIQHENLSEQQMLTLLQSPQTSDQLQHSQRLLKGLIKSVEQTQQLLEQEPNATWARIEYHQFDDRDADKKFPDAWYREINKNIAGIQEFHLQRVSDDLNTPLHTIIYGKSAHSSHRGLNINESVEIESRQGNFDRYTCDIKESISGEQNGIEYEVVNLAGGEASSFEGCSLNRPFDGRYLFVNFSDENAHYTSQFYFSGAEAFSFLNEWQYIQRNDVDVSLQALVQQVRTLPYHFTDNSHSAADWWVKSKEYTEDGVRIRVQRNSNQEWTQTVINNDETETERCSHDGKIWRDC